MSSGTSHSFTTVTVVGVPGVGSTVGPGVGSTVGPGVGVGVGVGVGSGLATTLTATHLVVPCNETSSL